MKSSTRRNLAGYAFISPGLIGLVAFCLIPMVYSLAVGFTSWNLKTAPIFVGLENFKSIFADKVAMQSIKVTLYYTVLAVPLINVCALFMALLLNTSARGTSYFRTIFYIPSIVPVVAASAIWMFIFNPFNGFLNSLLLSLGLPGQMWIYSTTQVIPCIAVMAAWSSGSTAIIYLAALQGVPAQLYEAIEIDGGNILHKFKNVTLPMISPVVFYNVVMSVISSMQAFTQGYIMTNGGPNNASMFYVLLLYKRAFTQSQMGLACAMAWLLFLVIGLITAVNFSASRKWVYYGG
jgi:multiple sugar transport system permease protein